jgi:hypothetical protein
MANAMKPKPRKVTRPLPENSRSPDWPPDKPCEAAVRFSKANQDQIVAGVEKGIRDLPVWKNMVRQIGLKAARQRLKLGLLGSQMPEGNSEN